MWLRKIKRKKILPCGIALLMLCCSISSLFAQSSYDSSFRNYYYDQKYSMFSLLPVVKNSIVWLGDSITDGGEWGELFGGKKNLNRGVSGDNTFGVLNRLQEVLRHKPQKVFILIGINDIARKIPVEVILRNYRIIVQRIKAESPGTTIYIQTLMPTNDEFKNFPNHQGKTDAINALNEGLKQLAKAENTILVDLYTPFLDTAGKMDKQFTNDGLHLSGAGYQHWKKVLLESGAMK